MYTLIYLLWEFRVNLSFTLTRQRDSFGFSRVQCARAS